MALTTVPASLSATSITLTTAAQPNITSVGTLTGLTVSGNIAGTLTTAAQTNITSLGTLSALTVTGGVTASRFDATTASTTDPVLQLTDAGVADYDFIFPDTSTIQLGTNTTSDKTFKLLNAGSGVFSLNVEGDIDATNVDASNSVYVGTNNSFFRENVVRFKSSGAAYFDHNTVGQDFIFRIGTSSTLDTTALVISDGTSTGYTLKVNGNIDIAQLKGSLGNAFLRFTDGDASADWSIGSDDGSGAGAGAFIIYDRSQSAYRAVINSGGRVGLGHTSPNARLHINAGNNTAVTIGDATNPALQIGGTTNYRFGVYTDGETAYIENKNGDDGLAFRVKTAGEAMRIDGGTGRVGIGDPTPRVKLEVHGGANEGIILKPAGQITYTPTSSNFYNGLTFENAGSAHAFSIAYGQGGWLKFSHFDNASTYSELAQLRATGDFYPMGNVVMAQGKGISFIEAADTATGETVSSSVLDDYEEGTFNGLMIPETGSITTGSSDNLCTYTRIGRLVTVQGRIQCSAASNPGGQLYVGNLPFSLYNAGENAFSSAVAVNLYNLASNMGGETVGEMTTTGGARILIRGNGGTTSSVHTAGNKIQANSIIGFTATYPTT